MMAQPAYWQSKSRLLMEFNWIPESLSTFSFAGLIMLSCFTSMLTASVGIGGGTVMLAVMAQIIPIKAIIPIHGVVQLGSNFGRALVMLPQLDKALLGWFLLGSMLGALLGGQVVISLPVTVLKITLGAFILYSVWGPPVPGMNASTPSLAAGGFVSTLLTMFVGATGPFVLAMLRVFPLPPPTLVSTTAACMVIQHLLKVMVFGLLGFAFGPWLPLVILMVVSGFIGTLIGQRILLGLDPEKFRHGLNIVLTLLALRLILEPLLS